MGQWTNDDWFGSSPIVHVPLKMDSVGTIMRADNISFSTLVHSLQHFQPILLFLFDPSKEKQYVMANMLLNEITSITKHSSDLTRSPMVILFSTSLHLRCWLGGRGGAQPLNSFFRATSNKIPTLEIEPKLERLIEAGQVRLITSLSIKDDEGGEEAGVTTLEWMQRGEPAEEVKGMAQNVLKKIPVCIVSEDDRTAPIGVHDPAAQKVAYSFPAQYSLISEFIKFRPIPITDFVLTPVFPISSSTSLKSSPLKAARRSSRKLIKGVTGL
jgi:hypothetical protein